jgi:hypothetical protein
MALGAWPFRARVIRVPKPDTARRLSPLFSNQLPMAALVHIFPRANMNLWQDLRYGARTLRKAPGFTLTAIVTMALGIGATTATFSVCDAILWKPLALPHLDQLVIVMQRLPDDPHDWVPNTPADAEDIRRQDTSFQGMAFWEGGSANIVGAAGEPERVKGYQVSTRRGPARPAARGRDRRRALETPLWRRSRNPRQTYPAG